MNTYAGRSVGPREEQIVYTCSCGERYAAKVWRVVSAEDATLRRRIVEGDLNRVRCPRCDASVDVQVPVLFHDGPGALLAYVAPPSMRHRELALKAELYALLAADAVPPPAYVLEAMVVFGAAGIAELLVADAPPVSQNDIPTALVPALPPQLEVPPVAPPPVEAPALAITAPPVVASETTVGPAPEAPEPIERELTIPRPQMTVPDPRTAIIERWIAAREPATALFVDDRVLVLASLPYDVLGQFAGSDGKRTRISLRPQLHRMASYPLIALTFVADEDGERPDESRVVHVPLDLARAAHRVALEQLQRRCVIELELFDEEYLPVVSHKLAVPFEDHLRHLVGEAKAAMERLPVSTRDFERARTAFTGPGYDRLGRTVIDLPSLDDVTRGSPAQVRAALTHVARWSEAAAEQYLLEIRGFPLPVWRKLFAATVRRATTLGIFVARSVAERAVRRAPEGEPLDLPPWSELIELMVRRFAELSAKLKPSDLSQGEEAANWELLLREADALHVPIDDAIARLADAAFQRAGGRPSRRPRPAATGQRAKIKAAPTTQVKRHVDVDAADSSELLGLLEDRDLRLEAAVALARRRETPTLPPLFAVLRRMSRAEAAALLPDLVAFGGAAERWLIDGARAKAAYVRQGCALALGRLATPLAIDALVRLLFDEPTEIWGEVARALGDVGKPAVMPLAARLREVEPEHEADHRDRIVHALAHVAARGGDSRQAVDALANGRDATISSVARRALVLAPEVMNAHEKVRTDGREQTLVRAFTRRFYDILGGADDSETDDIPELDAEDLVAFEAEPEDDEDDLIEEVSDARIALMDLERQSKSGRTPRV